MMASALKFSMQLISPKFYAAQFQSIVASTRADIIAGSAAPMFKGMALVGVVGYVMEYSIVGRKIHKIYQYYFICPSRRHPCII
jgi:hypothetical protein